MNYTQIADYIREWRKDQEALGFIPTIDLLLADLDEHEPPNID